MATFRVSYVDQRGIKHPNTWTDDIDFARTCSATSPAILGWPITGSCYIAGYAIDIMGSTSGDWREIERKIVQPETALENFSPSWA